HVFLFQAEDGIRDFHVTGVQTCALPISAAFRRAHAHIEGVETGAVVAAVGLEMLAREIVVPGLGPRSALDQRLPAQRLEAVHPRSEERRVGKEWRAGLSNAQ